MGKGTYYAGRALGRIAVRERNKEIRSREKMMEKYPELFEEESDNKNVFLGADDQFNKRIQEMSPGDLVFQIICYTFILFIIIRFVIISMGE